jgi:peptide-methionine (S)-S-oxide reductase
VVQLSDKTHAISKADALPGRTTPMPVATLHAVNGHSMTHVPANMQVALFAMGCFWGVERLFWQLGGVHSTAAGYAGGFTPNPTYREVCSGQTGHAEVVRIVFDPAAVSYEQLLQTFWENHDPAQGMRQGGDIGTQYRSAIYALSDEQQQAAQSSLQRFQAAMSAAGDDRTVTTEIGEAMPFYYAEDDHQQYLYKNPEGYCGLGGIGVCLPAQLQDE